MPASVISGNRVRQQFFLFQIQCDWKPTDSDEKYIKKYHFELQIIRAKFDDWTQLRTIMHSYACRLTKRFYCHTNTDIQRKDDLDTRIDARPMKTFERLSTAI